MTHVKKIFTAVIILIVIIALAILYLFYRRPPGEQISDESALMQGLNESAKNSGFQNETDLQNAINTAGTEGNSYSDEEISRLIESQQ